MWQHAVIATLLIVQEPAVPFEPGLSLTWASSLTGEPDYEGRLTLLRADSEAATMRISWNRRSRQGQARWVSDERQLPDSDRRLARSGNGWAKEDDPAEYPGSPYFMASVAVLNELKRQGRASVELLIPEASPAPYTGALERIGTAPEQFPVLVNGRRVTLPGIRATGSLDNPAAPTPTILVSFLYLDDSVAPWWLEAQVHRPDGTGGRHQLVSINYPGGGAGVEAQLAERCRASVYDLYFATASAELDSASTPALSAIARALRDHPHWQLTIVGDTDSIGGTADNLDLSRRRATRARDALVADYRIAAARLQAEGRGESQPIEDNGTLAGRARNRRVELVRECGGRSP
jgi:outer membrane protein OmpA-like peptidoglycan-associated protein